MAAPAESARRVAVVSSPDYANAGEVRALVQCVSNAEPDACDEMHAFWSGRDDDTKAEILRAYQRGVPMTVHLTSGATRFDVHSRLLLLRSQRLARADGSRDSGKPVASATCGK